eukprot:10868710-Alexandrium_andersonii.AAC.1
MTKQTYAWVCARALPPDSTRAADCQMASAKIQTASNQPRSVIRIYRELAGQQEGSAPTHVATNACPCP